MRSFTSALAALALATGGARAQDAGPQITRYAWTNSAGPFSRHALASGRGPGSLHYLLTAREPGSLYFLFNGRDFGSAYFFANAREPGSRFYWHNGPGPGSRHYWENGSGCLSRFYWENGGAAPPPRDPCPAGATAIVFVQTLCLAGLLDLEPCDALRAELDAARQRGGLAPAAWAWLERFREAG